MPDRTVFRTRYGASLDGIQVVDGYAGRLNNGGERLHVLAASNSERDVQFEVDENVKVGGYFRVTVRLRE